MRPFSSHVHPPLKSSPRFGCKRWHQTTLRYAADGSLSRSRFPTLVYGRSARFMAGLRRVNLGTSATLGRSFVLDPSFVPRRWQEQFYERIEADRSPARRSSRHPSRSKQTRRAENACARKPRRRDTFLLLFVSLFFPQLRRRHGLLWRVLTGLYLVDCVAASAVARIRTHVYLMPGTTSEQHMTKQHATEQQSNRRARAKACTARTTCKQMHTVFFFALRHF